MAGKPLRDMVIVLPGITGSVLQKDGKDVWAISRQATSQWLSTLGGSLHNLRLDTKDAGSIVATRVMHDAHIVPGLVKVDGYSAIAQMVTGTFNVVAGSIHTHQPANFIEFPYDWRLDNRVSARELAGFIATRLQLWRNYSHNPTAKVIFLAHSMGGLIARHYLEVLEGWRDCRALITFGTPYRGSPNALNFLANGYKRLFVDLTEVMRSFPSIYQLLPIYRALRVGPDYVRLTEANGIPKVDPARVADALAFHQEIEAKVAQHQGDAEYLTKGYVVMPIVGTRQPTMQSAVLTDGLLTGSRELPGWIDPLLNDGDGTVPRLSATPIELSEAYRDSFAPERHGWLQRNRSILHDVRGRLEQMQVKGLSAIRAPEESPTAAERPALALDLDDYYASGEPITMRASLINAQESETSLQARVEPVGTAAVSPAQMLQFGPCSGGWTLELDGLPPGLYRIEVRTMKSGPLKPPPVHDLFEIGGTT